MNIDINANSKLIVLLSTYGNSPYYEEQINSLKNQEIPIGIVQRCDDFPDHLGINGSYRYLMSLVPKDCLYVFFCDQDDVWLSSKVSKMYNTMIEVESHYPGPILIHCDAMISDDKLQVKKSSFIRKWASRGDFFGTLMFNKVQGASMMINRCLLDLVADLPVSEIMYDRYIHLMAETTGKRVFLDESLMYYRQHSLNAIGAGAKGKKLHFRFLNGDDRRIVKENEVFYSLHQSLLDSVKTSVLKDYIVFVSTRNPIKRMKLIVQYLWPYPMTFIKKMMRVFLP